MIPLTVFQSPRLYKGGRPAHDKTGKIANWLAPQIGVRVALDWDELCVWLSRPVVSDDKASEGGVALAYFAGDKRAKSNVEGVGAIGLDGDHTGLCAQDAATVLGRYRAAVYTTFNHTSAAPRWRAIVELSRLVSREEHGRLLPLVHANFADAGIELDPACKDASRLWFAPAVRPGAPYELHMQDGKPLDVDAVLGVADDLDSDLRRDEEQRRQLASSSRQRHSAGAVGRLERARRYLRKLPGAVSGSNGHDATFWAAVCMVRGFSLSEADALALMLDEFNPRCVPPWPANDLARKVAQGANSDKADGFLLEAR